MQVRFSVFAALLVVLGVEGCGVNRAPIDARYSQNLERIRWQYDQFERDIDEKRNELWARLDPFRRVLVPVDGAGTPLQPIFPSFEEQARSCTTLANPNTCQSEVYDAEARAVAARYSFADQHWALAEYDRFAHSISLEVFMARSHNDTLGAKIKGVEQVINQQWTIARSRIEADRAAAIELAATQRNIELERAEEERRRTALAVAQAFHGMGQSLQAQSPSPTYQSSGPTGSVAVAQQPRGCSSDYECSYGSVCVKNNYSINGVCMKAVNSLGTPTFQPPAPDSVQVKTPSAADCRFNTECPIGFRCDANSGACIN